MGKFKSFYLSEITGKEYDYSCLLIDFPEPIASEIKTWAKFNIPDEALAKDGREDEPHVTVLYGVHSADPSESMKYLSLIHPFEITLGNISKFVAPDCDVLKIEVFGNDLHTLRRYIESGIENTQTHPEYKPHVTLVYCAKNSCDNFIGSNFFAGRKVLVDSVSFSSKDGTRTRIPLQ